MPNTLTKIITPAADAVPGVGGSPGSPGTPTTPGYYTTVTVNVPAQGHYLAVPIPIGSPGYPGMTYAFIIDVPATTRQETIYIPPAYGTPPTPATPGVGGIPEKPEDFNFGWNAGGESVSSLSAGTSGSLSFSVNIGAAGTVVGFCEQPITHTFAEATHAFYFAAGTGRIIESGLTLVSGITFLDTDVFSIQRSGSIIRYYKGATLLYTSAVQSYGTIRVVGTLYTGGDTITNAVFGTALPVATSLSARCINEMMAMQSTGGIGTNGSNVSILPLTSVAVATKPNGGHVSLLPLTGKAANKLSVTCRGDMKPLTSYSKYAPRPLAFTSGAVTIRPAISFCSVRVGAMSVRPRDSAGDNTQAWRDGELVGRTLNIVGGTGVGQSRTILVNNAQQMFFGSDWSTIPDNTSVYTIT